VGSGGQVPGGAAGLVCGQDGGGVVVEDQVAVAGPALGWVLHAPGADGGDLVVDGGFLLGQPHLAVAQAAGPAGAGAAVGDEVEHRVQVGGVVGGVVEELRDLLVGPDHDRSGHFAGGFPPLHAFGLPHDRQGPVAGGLDQGGGVGAEEDLLGEGVV